SPDPDVFSTSHGALASTPTRSTPAFLIASIRELAPGAGTGTSAFVVSAKASTASPAPQRNLGFIGFLLVSVVSRKQWAAGTVQRLHCKCKGHPAVRAIPKGAAKSEQHSAIQRYGRSPAQRSAMG